MTLTVKLDDQTRIRLDALIAALNVGTQSDAIRKLIDDKFAQLQLDKTMVERRGGHPLHLLQGASNLSERDTRKAVIVDKLAAKNARRQAK